MPKRLRQSDNSFASGKRRRGDGALGVQCPFRVYAREHRLDYPEDHCKEGQTFKGNEKLKFVTRYARFTLATSLSYGRLTTNPFITTKRAS